MREQVGWYDPKNKTFCDYYKKFESRLLDLHMVPVYTDEPEVVPMPPCKEPRVEDPHEARCRKLSHDAKLWREIQLQVLENQCAMLFAMRMQHDLRLNIQENLINERRISIDLLEKGKELIE